MRYILFLTSKPYTYPLVFIAGWLLGIWLAEQKSVEIKHAVAIWFGIVALGYYIALAIKARPRPSDETAFFWISYPFYLVWLSFASRRKKRTRDDES